MKFNEKWNLIGRCVDYSMAKEKRLRRSHKWFAWYPIQIENESHYAFFEFVDRDRVDRSGENYSISFWRYYSRK